MTRRTALVAGLLASGSLAVLHQVIPHEGLHAALAGIASPAGAAARKHGTGAALGGSPPGKRRSHCPKHPPPFIHDSFPQPAFRHSRNGVLATRLRAAAVPVQINGGTYVSSVYERTFTGPTLVLCRGDTVRILLQNRLDPANFTGHHAGVTNLHTHGLYVSPESPQDNVFVEVPPGSNYRYRYEIPADEPPGAYWYHPHVHGQASPQTRSGMAGAMIVEGGLDAVPAYRSFGQRALVIQRTALGNGVTLPVGGPTPAYFFVNGHLNPKIPIRPGEIQRWSIFNATNGFFVRLKLGRQRFQLLARDGNYLSRRIAQRSMVIPPGSRREVLVQGGRAGSTELIAVPFSQFVGDAPVQETLATVVSKGRPVHDRLPPKQIAHLTDLRRFKVDHRHQIVYTEDRSTDPVRFLFNGRQFAPNRVDQVMHRGKVEQWTIRNRSDEWHTFHIHINDFQVTNIDGKPVAGVHKADNVEIAPGSTMTMLTRPTVYTGKFVFHCHVLGHEDLGMMATVHVKP